MPLGTSPMLQELLEGHTLTQILQALSEAATAKAEGFRADGYPDEMRAREWDQDAYKLDRLAKELNN